MNPLDIAMGITDFAMATVSRSLPARERLDNCRIVSHRGEHDQRNIKENTQAAFRRAHANGVWGIELDIRFTVDDIPVICHDPDLYRVFGLRFTVATQTLDQLQAICPEVPTLDAVIEEFGGKLHLMLETKSEAWPRQQKRQAALQSRLAKLRPVDDFHLLSLDPDMFQRFGFLPPHCMLPVAELNIRKMSQLALKRGYAGLSGHYLLLNERLRERHAAAGQSVGTGFPNSENCLRRELNRGIDWIFSNDAVKLESLRQQMLTLSH
ncbi:MAG: glycerophosphodiester phosphodiesterase family protein [Pseudomonadota bacterium]